MQLTELAKPFPDHLIHKNPSGRGRYVKHSAYVQRLLGVCGPFEFRINEIIRGDAPGKEGEPALKGVVVACTATLVLWIDGRSYAVTEVGECERPSNWDHDGSRLKDAASDALKRCAMRFGVGLHLWGEEETTLYTILRKKEKSVGSGDD